MTEPSAAEFRMVRERKAYLDTVLFSDQIEAALRIAERHAAFTEAHGADPITVAERVMTEGVIADAIWGTIKHVPSSGSLGDPEANPRVDELASAIRRALLAPLPEMPR